MNIRPAVPGVREQMMGLFNSSTVGAPTKRPSSRYTGWPVSCQSRCVLSPTELTQRPATLDLTLDLLTKYRSSD